MAHKRRDLTRADGESNRSVDQVGKKRDAVLEVIPCDLHDTSGVLDNGDFGV